MSSLIVLQERKLTASIHVLFRFRFLKANTQPLIADVDRKHIIVLCSLCSKRYLD